MRRPPEKKTKVPGKLANSTINDFMRLVYRVITFAGDVLSADLPSKPKPSAFILHEAWRIRELKLMEELRLETTTPPEMLPIWKFLVETGIRETPCCELQWSQVDTSERASERSRSC